MSNYNNSPYYVPTGGHQVPPQYDPYRMGQQPHTGQPNIGFNVHPPPPNNTYNPDYANRCIPQAGAIQGYYSNTAPVTEFTGNDEESGSAKGFDFTDKSIRLGFIRKVFAILMVQLLITFGFIALLLYHVPTREFVQRQPELLIAAGIVLIVTMIALACCGTLRRKSPANYILLITFTLAESFFLGVITSNYKSEEVLMAVGVTAAVCLGLTIFALQTKWDFTAWGGILFVFLLIFVIVGIAAIFIRGKIFGLIYASIGALLFCVYLVYDIQIMMGGKHKYSISPEEYIFAALNLYLDIINIFMYVLQIIRCLNN